MRRRQFLSTVPVVATAFVVAPSLFLDRARAEANSASTTGTIVKTFLDRWTVAKPLTSPPDMDGTISDPVWSSAPELRGFLTPYFLERADEEIRAKIAYDAANLFVAFDYRASDGGASLTTVEILLSPEASGQRYFRVPVKINNAVPPYSNGWGPATALTNVQVLTNRTRQGVTAEVRVPLESMEVSGVEPGAEWRCNLVVQHGMMTKPVYSWVPVRAVRNSFSGSAGGAAVFGEVTTDARLGTVYMGRLPGRADMWTPEDFSLTYVGFTEKAIAFQRGDISKDARIGLAWKMADGSWEPVDGAVSAMGDTIRVSFEHAPPRRNGLYGLRIRVEQPSGATPHKLAVVTFDRNALITAGDALYTEVN